MADSTINELIHLLQQAGAAHGEYETRVLNGVYDQQWAGWYAKWLVDNGINTLLGTSFEAEALGTLLYDLNEELKQSNTSENWAQYTAPRLLKLPMGSGE